MRHEFSRQVDADRTCVCHGWDRAQVLAGLPQTDTLPLVGLGEIAMRAGVQKPAVAMWRLKDIGFPQPVGKVATSYVWWWPDVQAWLEATGRRSDAEWTREQISPRKAHNLEQLQVLKRSQ